MVQEATEKAARRAKVQTPTERKKRQQRQILEAMRSMRESYKHKSSSKLKPSLKRMN